MQKAANSCFECTSDILLQCKAQHARNRRAVQIDREEAVYISDIGTGREHAKSQENRMKQLSGQAVTSTGERMKNKTKKVEIKLMLSKYLKIRTTK